MFHGGENITVHGGTFITIVVGIASIHLSTLSAGKLMK